VVPGLAVAQGDFEVLRPWVLPLPVPWSGHVRVPALGAAADTNSQDVPRAVIRIFALLNDTKQPVDSPKDGASLVQIAEARANAEGSFDLVMPDRLEHP